MTRPSLVGGTEECSSEVSISLNAIICSDWPLHVLEPALMVELNNLKVFTMLPCPFGTIIKHLGAEAT